MLPSDGPEVDCQVSGPGGTQVWTLILGSALGADTAPWVDVHSTTLCSSLGQWVSGASSSHGVSGARVDEQKRVVPLQGLGWWLSFCTVFCVPCDKQI